MPAGPGKLKGHLTWISGLMVVGKRTAVSTSEQARAAVARREARMMLSRSRLPQGPTVRTSRCHPHLLIFSFQRGLPWSRGAVSTLFYLVCLYNLSWALIMHRTASSAVLRLDVQARRLSLEHPSTRRKLSNTWSRRCSHIAAWLSIHRPCFAEDVPFQLVRLFSPRIPIIDEGRYRHSLHMALASPSCSSISTGVPPCQDRFTQPISICTTASMFFFFEIGLYQGIAKLAATVWALRLSRCMPHQATHSLPTPEEP
jgi:hypothetical protein